MASYTTPKGLGFVTREDVDANSGRFAFSPVGGKARFLGSA